MDKIIMLGTGSASSMNFYNACFALKKDDNYMLVDGGGGIGVLEQLNKAKIPIRSIKNIFVTHNHIDHISGIIWVIRQFAIEVLFYGYDGDINVYASDVTIDAIRTISLLTLNSKMSAYLDDKVHLNVVGNRDVVNIYDEKFTFYDVYASKEKQYGFRVDTSNNIIIVCNGDEQLHKNNYDLVQNCDYLIHEAFCFYFEKEKKKPYEKCHVTAKDVCDLAKKLCVKNLILYHIKDEDVAQRKTKYLEENKKYFDGNLYVPNDLDIIEI